MAKQSKLDSNSINVLKYYKGEIHHHDEEPEEWQDGDGDGEDKSEGKAQEDESMVKDTTGALTEVVGGGFDGSHEKRHPVVYVVVALTVILAGSMAAGLAIYLLIYMVAEVIGSGSIYEAIPLMGDDFSMDRFLYHFPGFGAIIIGYLIAVLSYFYLALKLGTRSRKAASRGILLFVAIPLSLFALTYYFFSPLLLFLQNSSSPAQFENYNFEAGLSFNFGFENIAYLLLSIIIIALLFFFKDKFPKDETKLGTWSKLFMIVVIILLALPTLGIVGYGYYQSFMPDDGYEVVEANTNFHVYKLNVLPEGLVQQTKFNLNESGTVASSYDVSIYEEEYYNSDGIRLLLIYQKEAPVGFDLQKYVENDEQDAEAEREISETSLRIAGEGKVFYTVLSTEDLKMRSLYFVTTDGVFIELHSGDPNIDLDGLRNIAESLQ